MPRWGYRNEPVSCRCCGATKAERGHFYSDLGICRVCENAIEHKAKKDLTEESVQEYLISRLKRIARDVETGKPVARCEAFGVNGYQCGGHAVQERLGKWVCSTHARLPEHTVLFTAAPQVTPETLVAGIVARMPKAMKNAIAEAVR